MSSVLISADVASRSRPMTREEKKVILASSAGTIGMFFVPETYKRDIFKA